MTSHLPDVTSTPDQRLAALREAKALLFVPTAENKSMFGNSSKSAAPIPDDLFRIAEYITTGHDYLDTHPKGKRRPVIQNIHVHAVGLTREDAEALIPDDLMEHLLHQAHEDKPAEETRWNADDFDPEVK